MKKIISTVALSIILNFTGMAQWLEIFAPTPATYNLRPYFYNGAAITPAVTTMQRNISDAVAALKISNSVSTGKLTGTFLRTHPSKPYVCLLTAGHGVMSANSVVPFTAMLNYIAFPYRRTTTVESWGDNFAQDVQFSGTGNVLCPILSAQYTVVNGSSTADYAIMAFPKNLILSGYYQAGYDFPQTLSAPTTRANLLFIIHHPKGQPQRLSEIDPEYADYAQNRHLVQTKPSPSEGFRNIGYWSKGSTLSGTSGAGLVSTSTGQPLVIGIHTSSYPTLTAPNFPAPTRDMETDFFNNEGGWITSDYMLYNIAADIRLFCGCTDKEAVVGLRPPPPQIPVAASQAIPTQSALVGFSSTTVGIQNYTHVGDALISATLGNIKANIHTQGGNIYLKPGFSAKMSDNVSMAAETMHGGSSAAQSSFAAPAILNNETQIAADSIAAKVQQSFKVYPSLTRGILNISPGNYSEAYTIRIMDMSGNELYKENSAAGGNRQMDLSSKLKAGGMYFVQIFPAGEQAPVTWKIEVLK